MTVPGETIEPDAKDWTWVLSQPCPDCGLEASAVAVADVGGLVRASVPRWRASLGRQDVRDRPDPGTWSPLEYGAHVRDVFRVFDERLALMLTQDAPTFANWDQDATALADRYGEQDPVVVAEELAVAADVIAARFDAVPALSHERRGLRSNGSEFTVTTLAQYFWHDVAHHLHDVGA
ncbi:methyltransferase type 12 [Serinibacter arcticus]|uniref:Methyltransferase type 12 n=1 Tax=Serinibacter arcticus TaxID=1655435 RepID=A0A2U1ZXS6_9MICO|nr:DinB family protein [Serinibacter arcticus]PWD51722.1 methyltransferase type 12 [Serinibacter arcticus]